MSPPDLLQGESRRNDRFYLSFAKQSQQSGEVVTKPNWLSPLEPLDAVRQHALSARQEEGGSDVKPDEPKAPKAFKAPKALSPAAGHCPTRQRRSGRA